MSKSETELLLAFLKNRSHKNLLVKSDLTNDTTIQMTRQWELVNFQVARHSDDKHFGEVNQVKGKPNPELKLGGSNRNLPHKTSKNTLLARPCSRCNCVHKEDESCPGRGKRCSKCRQVGHFAAVCRSVEK